MRGSILTGVPSCWQRALLQVEVEAGLDYGAVWGCLSHSGCSSSCMVTPYGPLLTGMDSGAVIRTLRLWVLGAQCSSQQQQRPPAYLSQESKPQGASGVQESGQTGHYKLRL